MVLLGLLAAPEMCDVLDLAGTPTTLSGRLAGGAEAGRSRDGWPGLMPGGQLTGREVAMSPALARYAAVMGLAPLAHDGRQVLGVSDAATGDPEAAPDIPLAAEIARQILRAPDDADPNALAARLPMTATWAASRLRAAAGPVAGQGVVPDRGPDAFTVLERTQPHLGYFVGERQVITHRLHDGGTSGPMTREGFLMGDAAVLLPWDRVRDRVLVVEQFRFAPALRGDPQPWLIEPVAGRVDAGEEVSEAILREAREEAGLEIERLVALPGYYPSPGAVGEYIYQFIGLTDLPDGIAGVHGLASESEDIRGHVMPRARLTDLVQRGQVANGPLVTLSLWLDTQVDRLRGEPAAR